MIYTNLFSPKDFKNNDRVVNGTFLNKWSKSSNQNIVTWHSITDHLEEGMVYHKIQKRCGKNLVNCTDGKENNNLWIIETDTGRSTGLKNISDPLTSVLFKMLKGTSPCDSFMLIEGIIEILLKLEKRDSKLFEGSGY